MENELIFNQLDEIEQKVVQLLTEFRSLETDNANLRERIKHLEQELNIKTDEQKGYLDERNKVRSRIDDLLKKLSDSDDD